MKNGKISKKFLSVLLSLCMVFTCTAPVFADSSAETERKELSKWTFDSQTEVDAIATYNVSAKKLTVDRMLKIEGSGCPQIYPFDGMSLSVGKKYVLSFDAKAGEAATGSVVIQCPENFKDQYLGINTETVSSFEYEFVAKSSSVPYLALLNGGECSGYYDNIYLYEIVDNDGPKNKVIKGWTFDSQADVDSFVVDSGTKEYENGAVKLSPAGAYAYAYHGAELTVGKEYIVEFKGKTASVGQSGYFAVFYPNGDIGFCNFDANGTEASYSNKFTATSPDRPYIVMQEAAAAYLDDVYLYEVTSPASIVASTPAAGDTVYPTDKIEIEFSDELSDDALTASSWKLTDRNGDTIAVSSVEKSGNKYTLNLAETTKNMRIYKLSFDGLKTAYNHPITTTSIDFISYEGETILYFPFSSAETSTWLYLQTGGVVDQSKFYNTDYYHSAPGSRWVEASSSIDITIKKGDNTDRSPELIDGEVYTVSFWAKPYVEAGQDASNVSLIKLNQGDQQYVDANKWQFEGTDWQYFETTYTQKGTGGLRYQFVVKDSGSPVKLYLDDLKISRKTELADFEIVSSNPANESTVGIVDSIKVNFANTPGTTAANTANYTLSGGTQTVTGAKIIDNSVIVTFSEPLTENTAYTLTMNIKDVAGRELVGRNTISFKTIANVLYKNYLSSDDDFNRPAFKEYATKEGNVALFNMSNEMDIYPFQNSSYVNTPLEKGKSYTIKFKAATTAEGNAKNFALVESDNSRFVDLIDDLSTEMKTYTVNFTAQTEKAPFFRMYTSDQSSSAKLLLDDIVLYTVPENEVYFEEVKLFANYGTDAQYQIFGDRIVDGDVSVVIEKGANCTGTEQNIMLMIAVYENNVLKNVVCDDLSLANNDIIKDAMCASITVPAQTEGVTRTLKAFVWNANNYSPYVDKIELKD